MAIDIIHWVYIAKMEEDIAIRFLENFGLKPIIVERNYKRDMNIGSFESNRSVYMYQKVE